jgi:DNA-binding CsgD family transcriptional regulator
MKPQLASVAGCSASPGHSLFSASDWLHLRAALGLSTRELQIVQRVFEDQKEEAMAAGMGISPHTVNTYMQRLYRKLHVCSRTQLIVRLMATHLALAIEDFNGTVTAAAEPTVVSGARLTDEDVTWQCRMRTSPIQNSEISHPSQQI